MREKRGQDGREKTKGDAGEEKMDGLKKALLMGRRGIKFEDILRRK